MHLMVATGFFAKILLWLVSGIYQIVDYAYQIFVCLAENNIFEYDVYVSFLNTVYVILGVVILFILAYNFLTLIIDPDKNKSGKVVWDLIKKMVVSFILILICPSIFSFAMKVQNSILTTNGGVIANLFGDYEDVSESNSIRTAGRTMAVDTFIAFFYPANAQTPEDYESIVNEGQIDSTIKLSDGTEIYCNKKKECNFAQAVAAAKDVEATGNGAGFKVFRAFARNVTFLEANEENDDYAFEFQPILSIVAGCYLAYCIISFCFDVAVRACKLALYEIIAPLCIAARLIPKWEDMYKKWKTNILETYLSLFQRVIILSFGCYLLGQFNKMDLTTKCVGCAFGVNLFTKVFVYMGINTFMKQAPKLIDDIFGLGKGVSFDIKKKFQEGKTPPKPIMAGMSAVGTGGRLFTKNLKNSISSIKGAEKGEKGAAIVKGLSKTIGGTGLGLVHGAQEGMKNSGSWKEWIKGGKAASDQVTEIQNKIEEQMTRYGMSDEDTLKSGAKKYGKGIYKDFKANVKDYFSDGAAMFNTTIEKGNKFTGLKDTLNAAADKVIDKNKSESGLVRDGEGNAQGFKGSNKATQEELFNKLTIAKGSKLSLADVEEYRKLMANKKINREDYADENAFTQEMLKHSANLAALDDMQTQLRKNAQEIVINARNNITGDNIDSSAVGNIKFKDLDKVRSAAENLEYAFTIDGNSVTDLLTGVTYGEFNASENFNEQMKNRMDAYEHNATIANANKQKYEQAAKARKDDK